MIILSSTFFSPYNSILSFHPVPLIWVPKCFQGEQGFVGTVMWKRVHPVLISHLPTSVLTY